jgi:hypothetical protein
MDENGVAAADPQTADRITKHAIIFYEKLMNFDRPTSVYVPAVGPKRIGAVLALTIAPQDEQD